ncbi:hypothetical protein ABZ260_32665 [Streptosporangium sp. NPDC006013]|uniref:hypothetical protein n=1 Tax=Streptosporangium sp. NPDC006013 TaxID=3155596 RepID=UPI0033A10E2E
MPAFSDRVPPEWLAEQITRMGVPAIAARGAAIRRHIQDSPAPIAADVLGFHPVTMAKLTASQMAASLPVGQEPLTE